MSHSVGQLVAHHFTSQPHLSEIVSAAHAVGLPSAGKITRSVVKFGTDQTYSAFVLMRLRRGFDVG